MNLILRLVVTMVLVALIQSSYAIPHHSLQTFRQENLDQDSAYAVMFRVQNGEFICYEKTVLFLFRRAFSLAEKEAIMINRIQSLIPEECLQGDVHVLGVEKYDLK